MLDTRVSARLQSRYPAKEDGVNQRRRSQPTRHRVVKRVEDRGTRDTTPAVALVGFVGDGRDAKHIRLYPDVHYQRWMDIPKDDIVTFEAEHADDPDGSRTVLWVHRDKLNEPLFQDGTIEDLDKKFVDGWISTWALIPESRYVAAEMLDLLAPWSGDEEEYST